ncbi:polysaccharide deacetylase family protein [Flavobacterium sufflavum]|uniref:Polysaccharide deacetylase family protein n=1 Tax=Flavobacterium sufflavum TaxID=1921138 RepID=A0A437L0P8_9FLAO|nr:polysaccharide deacetylase family protein [Flavobacterium sufflavum]RVT78483.1 polysaccharide deacetylase family protein [Flavobacterium sufflavum]
MKPYWIKTHSIIKKIFSNYVWDIPNNEKKIYLTFDDGPTPEITSWVLNQLEQYNAKATFFCIGKNIAAHSEIFAQIQAKGHSIGNHTNNHLNGWKTSIDDYLENISCCENTINNLSSEIKDLKSKIFRPPYGKIKRVQAKKLRQQGYKIIMWDVLSADFDQNISKEECLNNVVSNTQSGSVIVFHDSVKAFKNLEYVLPKVLKHLADKHFSFEAIKD